MISKKLLIGSTKSALLTLKRFFTMPNMMLAGFMRWVFSCTVAFLIRCWLLPFSTKIDTVTRWIHWGKNTVERVSSKKRSVWQWLMSLIKCVLEKPS